MALAPWGFLGGGKFRTDEEEEMRRASGENGRALMGQAWERSEDEKIMSRALEKVAKEVGAAHLAAGPSLFPFSPLTAPWISSFLACLLICVSSVAIVYVMQKVRFYASNRSTVSFC